MGESFTETGGPSTPTTGTESRSKAQGYRSKPALVLGHHRSPHHCPRDLALPRSGDRALEPQGGGLGCC